MTAVRFRADTLPTLSQGGAGKLRHRRHRPRTAKGKAFRIGPICHFNDLMLMERCRHRKWAWILQRYRIEGVGVLAAMEVMKHGPGDDAEGRGC